MKKLLGVLLAILILCFGGLAQAYPIAIQISGNVTSASGSALPSTIYQGVTFIGTYIYDSETIDSGNGHYVHNAPYGISISLGGYEFKTAPSHVGQFDIWVANDLSSDGIKDYYSIISQWQNISAPSLGFNIGTIRWDISDSTHTALSSDGLPLTAPMLSKWDCNMLYISGSGLPGSGLGGLTIMGTVTQIAPEPLTGILMIMGVLFLKRR